MNFMRVALPLVFRSENLIYNVCVCKERFREFIQHKWVEDRAKKRPKDRTGYRAQMEFAE
jgi:hypothetical protein